MAANNRQPPLKELIVIIRGAGEQATGIACRLYRANFKRILMLETSSPLAVRRLVSFCEAIHETSTTVEGIEAVRVTDDCERDTAWESGKIAVLIDPQGESLTRGKAGVFIDATLAKRNLGTSITDAPLVIALGPGFTAGADCHVVIETNRGHDLGRLISSGMAAANTGIPGDIAGYTKERVLRAPADGVFTTEKQIGDRIRKGEVIGMVGTAEVASQLDGILRGLIRPGSVVRKGLKIGDVDPRGEVSYCTTISEKARALGGAVLEAILGVYNG
ncbi:MAG: selenium-dependent molybdenum cofactor biosynthesis protein YqeB [Desulfuromonadaceae bacterium]